MTTNPHPGARARAFRGRIAHCIADPAAAGAEHAVRAHEDGALVVRDGRVVECGEAGEVLARHPDADVVHLGRRLIVPGFIDTHVHYAQTDVIASGGESLLGWLERYTFPAEAEFADPAHAADVAGFFIDQLLRNGTTSALAFCTVHPQSVDALFEQALARRMRLVAGKVMMDANCPPFLRDTAQSSEADSLALIRRWHGRGRLGYAITPRFAGTSTAAQLEAAARLAAGHPDVHLQSHVAENRDEVAWIAGLFPGHRSYLDVYDRFGLLRPRAVYAHCIWLDEHDRARMAATGTAAAFCPTSNTFLGSGLFDGAAARKAGMLVGLATDVGGGTSFSMLATMHEAYKVARLGGWPLGAWDALYLATLGGARALALDASIGSFQPGREADFVVLDPAATPLLARRTARCDSFEELVFALMVLGDDRAVAETWLLGEPAWRRPDS